MRIADIIYKKRNGAELTDAELHYFIDGLISGEVKDYQTSALLMAIYFRGMTDAETVSLTRHMAYSGDVLDLSNIIGVKADKHSTGGVGDKTTLITAPLAAACGLKIAKMSGRGLGHTGGTIDKLASISGFRTELSTDEFMAIVQTTGVCVAGQTGNFAPADKILYALRDVTATVDKMPLIASSIMSKKIAAGADCIVLDVKCGSGAFMKTEAEAVELAECMVRIGRSVGKRMSALITNMDIPLGNAIGNALEVQEAIEVLQAKGPADSTAVSVALTAEMLCAAGCGSPEQCLVSAREALESGAGYRKFEEWVTAQGGNPQNIPAAPHKMEVKAPQDGVITSMNTERVGIAAMLLGAGRSKKEDSIDLTAGIILHAKTGSRIHTGETIAELYTTNSAAFGDAEKELLAALTIGEKAIAPSPLILRYIR